MSFESFQTSSECFLSKQQPVQQQAPFGQAMPAPNPNVPVPQNPFGGQQQQQQPPQQQFGQQGQPQQFGQHHRRK